MRPTIELCFSTLLARLSSFTSITAWLLELETSTPIKVNTPATTAAITDSMGLPSPGIEPSGEVSAHVTSSSE